MKPWAPLIWLTLSSAPAALPAQAGTDACPATRGQAVLDLVNAERAARGLSPYRVNLRLYEAAQAHAKDLASGPDAGHRGSDGSDPSQRAHRVGYLWTFIGENVAAGQTSAAEVVEGWMGSEAHRHNILDTRFRDVAVGVEPEAASRWGTYWVMMFGSSDDSDAYRTEECNP